jgi:hypothetical protein
VLWKRRWYPAGRRTREREVKTEREEEGGGRRGGGGEDNVLPN